MLYGWIEVGASNSSLFSGTNNDDIIIRTVYNSKIILGNTNGTATPAAMYVYGNNVGINKVPDADTDLDVNGKAVIKNLVVGFSNYIGDSVLNGPFVMKDTAKNFSSEAEMVILNSNNNVYFRYNGIERTRITDGQGMHVNDNIYIARDAYAEAFQVTSDVRFKTNITPSDSHTDMLSLLKLNVYDYTISNKQAKGFLAQEVKGVCPQSIQYKQGYIPFRNTHATFSNDHLIITEDSSSKMCSGALAVSVIDKYHNIHPLKVATSCNNIMQIDTDVSDDAFNDGDLVTIQGIYADDVHSIDTNQILAMCVNTIKALHSRLENLENNVCQNKC
jgi:hypothetical protein